MNAIEVEDLWYTYPGSSEPSLKGVGLKIGEGELVAIVGENGAGKTTLVKHFVGLLKPQRGYVRVYGLDVAKARVSELAKLVGFVFQSPDHQLFSETVEDEVAFAPRNQGYPKELVYERVNKILNALGLDHLRKRSPFKLSGGERKRVALASILSYDPRIIILDEPTVGQDANSKKELIRIVESIVSEGRTVIIVTHDVDLVAELVPKVIIISKGKVLAEGSVEELMFNLELLKRSSLLPPARVELTLALYERGFLARPSTFKDEALIAKEVAARWL